MRRPSLVTIAAVPVLLSLVGNLATGVIHIPARAAPLVIAAAMALAVASVAIEARRTHSNEVNLPGHDELKLATSQLAGVVGTHWRREEERRRLHDPFPLPVRWHVADEELIDQWANIRRLPAGVSAEPLPVAGQFGQIVAVYRRIPSGRLLILGRPGSGKTMLAVRFVLDWLAAGDAEAVPVIASLGSWNPSTTPLRDWLIAMLIRDYSFLSAPSATAPSLAAALVDAGRVLPVLDGFDEIADGLHQAALEALNGTSMPLIVTSRDDDYAAAVRAGDVLSAAAGIELDALVVDDLVAYLPRAARRTRSEYGNMMTHWDPLLAVLQGRRENAQAAIVAGVLSSPLMVGLARAIYSNTERDPVELLDARRFPTAEALEDHLLSEYVPSIYKRPPLKQIRPRRRVPWSQRQVSTWLAFVAAHLTWRRTYDLAWWHLHYALGKTMRGTLLGSAVGLAFGLAAGLTIKPEAGLVFGLIVGSAVGLAMGRFGPAEPAKVDMRFAGTAQPFLEKYRAGAVVTAVVWLSISLAAGIVLGPAIGLIVSLASALTLGLATGVLICMTRWVDNLAITQQVSDPLSVLRLARAATLGLGPAYGLVIAGIGALLVSPTIGLAAGLAAAVTVGLINAWGGFVVSRSWLALNGKCPWRLMAFLDDAHDRGVLRQVGAVYQFRHSRLQDHFALGALGPAQQTPPGLDLGSCPHPDAPTILQE